MKESYIIGQQEIRACVKCREPVQLATIIGADYKNQPIYRKDKDLEGCPHDCAVLGKGRPHKLSR